jgi:hypothetical protein
MDGLNSSTVRTLCWCVYIFLYEVVRRITLRRRGKINLQCEIFTFCFFKMYTQMLLPQIRKGLECKNFTS